MARYRSARDLDWALLLLCALIASFGVLQIFSATYGTAFSDAWWKQIIWILAGFLVMWLISLIDYHYLLDRTHLLYLLSLVTLIIVLVVGTKVFGSRRWIPLFGGLRLQVSEFVKLVIILVVARYLTELRTERLEFRDLLKLGTGFCASRLCDEAA